VRYWRKAKLRYIGEWQSFRCRPGCGWNPEWCNLRHREAIRLRGVRIPVKATMDSDAWRPLDPVDDDQGGA